MIPQSIKIKPDNERRNWLRANADKVEKQPVFVTVDAEERAEIDNELSKHLLEQHRIEKEKKEILDEFKERLKPLKDQIKDSLEVLDLGGRQVEKEVYLIADHDQNKMFTYDEDGAEISSRRLTRGERQSTIQNEMRSVSGELN